MPKLAVVTSREFIRVLRKLGFVERPESGSSHLGFSHPDGRYVALARHGGKDIPRGTLKGMLKDAKLSNEEFARLLRE